MVNSNTGFGKLKEVIVGRELNLERRISDLTFRQFYKENISEKVYENLITNDGIYKVNQDLIIQRNIELDALAKILESKDIIVHRPDKLEKIVIFKTPEFKSELSSASNVRDLTLVYNNKIIETPTYVRNRYFENTLLYNVFNKSVDQNAQWIKAPNTKLIEERLDLDNWKEPRDYNKNLSNYDMAIDGAQFLRIGKDCIVNITSYNHYLGYLWVKSFFPEVTFHIINVADNHIDGVIIALKPGTFLVDPKYPNIKELLPKFKHWNFIYPKDFSNLNTKGLTDIDIQLASSRGMDINILSLDTNTVIVNEKAIGVKEILDNNGFDIIETKLENGEIFAGGIHCSTLDMVREDEFISY